MSSTYFSVFLNNNYQYLLLLILDMNFNLHHILNIARIHNQDIQYFQFINNLLHFCLIIFYNQLLLIKFL